MIIDTSEHIMIDLETLNTTSRSLILSIGAVRFNRKEILDTFYVVPTLQDQINMGRTMSESTLTWWMNQSEEAKKVFLEQKTPFDQSLKDLAKFIQMKKKPKIWGYGADFDPVIVMDAYQLAQMECPYFFSNIRCLRTVCDDSGKKLPKNEGVAHNALSDAVHQTNHLISIWKERDEFVRIHEERE